MMSNLGPFFAPIQRIGGDHGHPFTNRGWVEGKSGLVVKCLDVWYNSSGLRGIQIAYSDHSSSRLYGNKSDSHGKIVFQPGERVVSMKLWSNGISPGINTSISKRTGRIRLRTDSGQVLDVGKDTTGQNPHIIDVGGGTLVGMMGSCGSDIHNLGAIFLKSAVTRVVITEIVLTSALAATHDGIENVTLKEVQQTNSSTRPTTWKFAGKESERKSTSYIETTRNTFGKSVSVEVAAKPLGIGITETGGFVSQHQSQQTTGTSTSDTTEVNWEASGKLDPGESITLTASVQRRKVRASYKSMVTIMLEDGSKNTYQDQRGQFQAYAYTKVKVRIAPSSSSNVTERFRGLSLG